MYERNEYQITTTIDRWARLIGCTTNEVAKCFRELSDSKTANVIFGNGDVTVLSRRLQRELSSKENNRLRVQRHRGNADVTPEKRDRVISKSNKKEEEKREEAAVAAPTPEVTFEPERFNHPAVVLFESIFGFKIASGFATSVARKVTNLQVWKDLLENKRAYADKPLKERTKLCGWILDAYDERVQKLPKIQRLPTVEERLREEAETRHMGLIQPPPRNIGVAP